MIIECTVCKKEYKITPNRLKTSKFCSMKCKSTSMKGKPTWNTGLKGVMKPNKTSFQKGFIPWNKNLKGIHLNPKGEFKKGQIPWNKGLTKEIDSRVEKYGLNGSLTKTGVPAPYNSKEKSHFWKGGISSENQLIRKGIDHRNWSKQVLIRDDYTCQICFDRGGHLHANHIKKFSDYKELRFDINNGITLCKNCHIGKVNHHEEEWEEYFKGRVNNYEL